MSLTKKVKFTVEKNIYDLIVKDLEDFSISNNFLMNYIFYNLKDEKINFSDKKQAKNMSYKILKKDIQFSLNKKNFDNYYEFLKEKKIQNEAKFMRELLTIYSNKHKNVRELFIFKELVERINYAITDKKNVVLTFRDGRKVKVSPYYVGSSELEFRNYIFCYDTEEEKYKNYKLKNLKATYTLSESANWEEEKYIRDTIKNFSPFLSNGNTVKIKFSEDGIRLLNSLKINRPKILGNDGDIYEFECSFEQARRYFTYFLDEATILEPLELKKYFIEKFEQALENLKK